MLAIFRNINGAYTMPSFMRGWATLMTPCAVLGWAISKSVLVSLLSFLSVPLVGICQGTFLMLSHRFLYVDSPVPKTPAHGIVVVGRNDATQTEKLGNACSCTCTAGRRWRRGALSEEEQQHLDQALNHEPLRLLVIGDSLALGIGVTSSCTAILPEVIAKTLSKSLQRPVYWTSHGSSGASSGWIVQELKRTMCHRYRAPHIKSSSGDQADATDDSSDDSSEEENPGSQGYEEESGSLKQWRHRLDGIRASDLDGPFDIVVVLTGANDVKATLFPFFIRGEESRFLEDAVRRGLSLTVELERILECLRPRMSAASRPLVVFPAMPTSLLPIFQDLPVRWLAVPVMGLMDNHKKQLAKTHEDCLFVEAPSVELAVHFEAEEGKYWERRMREDTLLALRDVTRAECSYICGTMREYCKHKGFVPLYRKGVQSQANLPDPSLRDRKGRASKLVFIDRAHANDEGFDFWGRHIADSILRQWSSVETSA